MESRLNADFLVLVDLPEKDRQVVSILAVSAYDFLMMGKMAKTHSEILNVIGDLYTEFVF
jgi:hypothetical protein